MSKNAFCAYRDWDRGEFDIIVFETEQEMLEFCEFNHDYEPYTTSVLSLQDAKDIFSNKPNKYKESENA